MHTLTMISSGLALLGVLILIGRAIAGNAGAAKWARLFIPIWLVISLVNMWVGVAKAGIPLSVEIPVLAAIFGVPAVIAFFLDRHWRGG